MKPKWGVSILLKHLHLDKGSTKSSFIVKIFTEVAITQLQRDCPKGNAIMDHKPLL